MAKVKLAKNPVVEILRCLCKAKLDDKRIVARKCVCSGFDQNGQERTIKVSRFVTVIEV